MENQERNGEREKGARWAGGPAAPLNMSSLYLCHQPEVPVSAHSGEGLLSCSPFWECWECIHRPVQGYIFMLIGNPTQFTSKINHYRGNFLKKALIF